MPTTTTTNAPPEYLQPYLQGAANAATQYFNQGAPQYYPGNTVVPFSQQTQQAMGMQQQRAMQGSPLVNQAQSSMQNMLGGNSPLNAFMSPQNNPHLDRTFDMAAGAVNRNLDTALARGGRDVTANAGARASNLGDLATRIYGGAFESGQNRALQAASTMGSQQLQAANQAIPLAREDYYDIGQLGQVGSQVEQQAGNIVQDNMDRFNFAQNAPWENLNRYMGVLTGSPYGGTQTTTAPEHSNPWGGALGGALAGYSLAGPWGALGGGALGFLGG